MKKGMKAALFLLMISLFPVSNLLAQVSEETEVKDLKYWSEIWFGFCILCYAPFLIPGIL